MKIIVTIDAKFGSDFQKETGLRMLEIMLEAWQKHKVKSHKNNKIAYMIERETIKDII